MQFWPSKRSIMCTSPLASGLCGCPLHQWWPAASSAGTPWGSSTTPSVQISIKTRFYRKAGCYLFLCLVILNLLIKFHQNCSNGSGNLYSFHQKILNCCFFCKMPAKKRFSLRTAKIHQYQPKAGQGHSKSTRHSNFKKKNIFFSHTYFFRK